MSRCRVSPWSMAIVLAVLTVGIGGKVVQATPPTNAWRFCITGDTRGDFDPAKTPPYDAATATGVSLVLPQIAAEIASMRPDFVLHVGDLVSGDLYSDAVELGFPGVLPIPYDQQFQAFKDAMKPITAANIPLYTVRGNHEVSCADGVNGHPDPALAAAYYQAYGRYMPQNYTSLGRGYRSSSSQKGLTYSFSHKQVTVVALDQYSDYVKPSPAPVPWYKPKNTTWCTNLWGYHSVDQAWVSDQLHRANTPFKIVIAHEPIFVATGSPYLPNGPFYQWYGELYFGPPSLGGQLRRQQFVDMMGDGGAQLYAVGHVHNMSVGSFEDSAGHKMYQLTAGNGGAFPMDALPDPPTPESALKGVRYEQRMPGFTLVTVNPDTNTMVLEYYVMDTSDSSWSKQSFTTEITGSYPPTAATDYSQPKHWLSLPTVTNKPVDVFYLYPTAWKNIDPNPQICAIDDPTMLIGAPAAFARQATAFSPIGNIYAPYYRQNNLSPINRENVVAGIPTTDAMAAFDYYIKHFSNGRPFILAGHSQGSDVLRNLLARYMRDNPSVYKRMVAAYAIGVSVTSSYLAENRHLKFAQGPDDTGVIVSYNTEAPDVPAGGNPVLSGVGLVINPITWTRGETIATTAEGLGSYMPNPATGVFSWVPQYADARIDKDKGVLICSTADEDAMYALSPGAGRGVYHSFDYPFYYFNLRQNAANRVSRYFSKRR